MITKLGSICFKAKSFATCLVVLVYLFWGLFVPNKILFATPKISIVWSTQTNGVDHLYDNELNIAKLDAGIQGNGDGDLVELGYFSEGVQGDPFQGIWIPLTQNTRVGDSSTGYGFEDGIFSFMTTFYKNSDTIVVYPTEPKEFSEILADPITTQNPPKNTPICIRFYDAPSKGGAKYNTVTGDDWMWPGFPDGNSIPSNLYWKVASGTAPSGSIWSYGNTFEDTNVSNNFKTSLSPTYSLGITYSEYSVGEGTFDDINGSNYTWGQIIDLNATPSDHSIFMGWWGSGITDPWNENTTLIVDGSQTVYAEFAKIPYQLTLESTEGGAVLPIGPLSFDFDTNVSVTATASTGNHFKHWQWHGSGVTWLWEQNNTNLGDLVYDLNNSTHLEELNSTYKDQTGYYSIIESNNRMKLFPVEYHESNNSWSLIQSATVLDIDKNKSQLKNWLDNYGYFPIEKKPTFSFLIKGDTRLVAIFEPNTYFATINLSSGFFQEAGKVFILNESLDETIFEWNSSNWGSATPTKVLKHGQTYTLRAVPNEKLYFLDGWAGTENQLSMLSFPNFLQTTFVPESDLNLIADFVFKTYKLVIQSTGSYDDLTSSPQIQPSLVVDSNNIVVPNLVPISVEPSEGFVFERWHDPYGILSTLDSNVTEANMSRIDSYDYEIAITAMLNIKTYDNLNVIIDINETEGNYSLESDPDGGYSHFSAYELSATAKLGFEFEKWEGNSENKLLLDSTEKNNQLLIDGNISLSAVFKPKEYNLLLLAEGTGWVDGPDRFTIDDQNVIIKANTFNGYRFSHWTGDTNYFSDLFTDESNRSLSWGLTEGSENLPKDLSLTAHFVPETHQIWVSSSNGGSVDYFLEGNFTAEDQFDGNVSISADSETRISLIALNDHGWQFSHWLTNSFDISDLNDSYAVFYPTADANYSAIFEPIEYDSSQIAITSSSGGEVEWNVSAFSNIEPSEYRFLHFSGYEIHATPDSGYQFMGWAGEGNTSQLVNEATTPINQLVIGGPISLVAEFSLIEYNQEEIRITSNDSTQGVVAYDTDPNGKMTHFNEYQLKAIPLPGYRFVRWSINESSPCYFLQEDNSTEITLRVEGEAIIDAHFAPIVYSASLSSQAGGSISSSLDFNFTVLDDPFIKAEENGGWDFSHWSGDIQFLQDENSSETMLDLQNADDLPIQVSFGANFIPEEYLVDVRVNSIDLGDGRIDISVGNNLFSDQSSRLIQINSQTTLELNSSASEGSYFSHWSGLPNPSTLLNADYNLSETTPDIHYTPSSDGNLTAHFKRIEYDNSQIQIIHNTHGNVVLESNDAGKYTHFDEYELTALPNVGYAFSHWQGDGNLTQLINGANSSSNFLKIEGPISLQADFNIVSYNISLQTEGNGSTTGPNSFTVLDTPILSANSSNGWRFDGWSGNEADIYLANLQSSEVPIQWSANSPPKNLSLTATFVPEEYLINFIVSGGGLIDLEIGENSSIPISSSNTEQIDSQTKISLQASATFGWKFSHWSGLPEESSLWKEEYSIVPNANSVYYYPSNDHNITAHFSLIDYNRTDIQIENKTGGSIELSSEDSGKYKHFSSYDLNATPWKGYRFNYWEVSPIEESNSDILGDIDESINLLQIEGPISISANFSKISYSLMVDKFGEGEVVAPTSFNVSDSPIITAQDKRGWDFSHWSGDIDYLQNSLSAQTNVIFPDIKPLKDLVFTAHFVRETYPISVDINGSGVFSILLDGANNGSALNSFNGTVESNMSVQLQAIPSDGWKFSRWIGLPSSAELLYFSEIINTSSLIDYVPPGPNFLTARFVRNTFTLEINSSNPFQGNAVGSGTYEFEEIVDINATPSEHFLFDGWTGDTAQLLYNSESAANSIVIPSSNISIRPVFKPKIYSINTYNIDGQGEITVKGTYNETEYVDQTDYNATSEVIVLFEPQNSYSHMLRDVYWTNSNGEEGLHFSSRFDLNSLDANYSFWATFTDRRKIKYSMTAVNPNQGNVYEDSISSSEQIQNIIATPNEGHSFIGWDSQGSETFQPHWSSHEVLTSLNDNSDISGHFSTKRFYPFVEFNQSVGDIDGMVSYISTGEEINLIATPKENYVFKNWEIIKEIDYNVSKGSSSIHGDEFRVFINDVESPEINLVRGFTYHFHCNLQGDENFFLSTSRNTSPEFDYTVGVAGNRIPQGILTFTVPEDAPDFLYYHLSGSPYFGNRVNIITADLEKILPFPNNSIYSASLSYDFGLIANFEPTRHNLSIEPEPQSKGTVSWSTQDIYFWGDLIEIEANPQIHWKFDRWTGSSHLTNPTSPQTTILIQENTNLVAHFSEIEYPLIINSIPEDYGEVISLDGYSLNYDDEFSLEINPRIGKQFDEWEYNNKHLTLLEEENPRQTKFKVLAEDLVRGDSISISAKFSKTPLQIGLQIITQNGSQEKIDEIGGEIISPSIIYHGDEVILEFNEFEGYRFLNWTDSSGNLVSEQNMITRVFTENETFSALVEKNEYQLDLNNNGSGLAKVSSSDLTPFEWNDSINIIATSDEHWQFVRWVGLGIEDVLNPLAPNTLVNIKQDSNLTAEFKLKEYTLGVNVNPLGFGSTSVTPSKSSYNFGDIVNISIYPTPNRKLFDKWSIVENLSFENESDEFDKNIAVKIEGDAIINAELYSQKYTISRQVFVVDSEDNDKILEKFGGSISGESSHFDGEDGNYTVNLNDGFKLLWWKDLDTNETLSTEESFTYNDFAKNLNLAAYVTERIYNVDITLSPNTGGSLIWGNYFILGNSFSANTSFGDMINFSAIPASNYKFSHWNIKEGNNPPYRLTSETVEKSVSNDLQISGYFAPTNDIHVSISSEPEEAAAFTSGDGIFDYNIAHTIIAKPKRNYEFSHWEWSNEYLSIADRNSSTTTITLDGNKSLTAVFKLKTDITGPSDDPNKLYLLSINSNEPSFGRVSQSGLKLRGEYTIEAIANPGFLFSHWTGSTESINDVNNSTTFVNLQQNVSVEAIFIKLHQLIVHTIDEIQGEVYGSGLALGWQAIEAIAKDGYEFSHWVGNNIENIYLESTRVNVQNDMEIFAHFQSVAGFDDSESLDNDWWGNPWFGYYWKFGDEDWLLHEDLGWIYMKKQGDSSIWVWVQKLETWLWTAKEHYPYLYSESSSSWYWVNLNQSDFTKLVLYNFGSSNPSWEIY